MAKGIRFHKLMNYRFYSKMAVLKNIKKTIINRIRSENIKAFEYVKNDNCVTRKS